MKATVFIACCLVAATQVHAADEATVLREKVFIGDLRTDTQAGLAALYSRVQAAVLSPALDDASVSFNMSGAVNQGLEADFHGEIAPGLPLLTSYAFIRSRINNYIGAWLGGSRKNAELLGAYGYWLYGMFIATVRASF